MYITSLLAVAGLVGAALGIPLQIPDDAFPEQSKSLSGMVVDGKQAPIASAELTLRRDGRVFAILRSSDTGTFSLDNAGRGTIQIMTRRIGFKAQTTTVDLDRTPGVAVLRIVLENLPEDVAPVVVTGRGRRLDLFYQHRKENAFGRFMDQQEIEKSRVRLASELFRTVPGASLRVSRRYGNLIRLRGCQPIVWIDRVPIRDVELDEVVVPEEIAGLEIYHSSSGVPPEFMDRGGRSCGAIVVWTRIN